MARIRGKQGYSFVYQYLSLLHILEWCLLAQEHLLMYQRGWIVVFFFIVWNRQSDTLRSRAQQLRSNDPNPKQKPYTNTNSWFSPSLYHHPHCSTIISLCLLLTTYLQLKDKSLSCPALPTTIFAPGSAIPAVHIPRHDYLHDSPSHIALAQAYAGSQININDNRKRSVCALVFRGTT